MGFIGYEQVVQNRNQNGTFKRKISDEKLKEIIKRYISGESGTTISKIMGIPFTTIFDLLRKNGIKTRPAKESRRLHYCDENIFNDISEGSAYWAGFIMADGSILERPNRQGRLVIKLAIKDKDHLEKFRKFIKSDYEVKYTTSLCSNGVRTDQCYINVHSSKITAALARYGIDQQKSYRGANEIVTKDVNFWRGVIDGDGTIHVGTSPGRCRVGLVGNKFLLTQFKEFCDYLGISYCGPRDEHPKKMFSFWVCGSNAIILCKFLYESSRTYLERKYLRAQGIIKYENCMGTRVERNYNQFFKSGII